MIPKVASLGNLAVQGTARSLAFRNSSVSSARQESGSSSHNRRRSLDARPKSRNGSAADLLTLEAHASGGNANAASATSNSSADATARPESPAPAAAAPLAISRPMSPALPMPLWTVAESPSCTPFGSYTDELAAFGKFAPLPRPATPTSPLGARALDSDCAAADGMGAAAAAAASMEQQELPPATPTGGASAVMDDLAVLTGACGDIEVDTPRTTPAAATTFAAAMPVPAVPPSPFTIAAVAVAAASVEPALVVAAAAKPAPPPPLQLPLASSTELSAAPLALAPLVAVVPTTNATAAPVSTAKKAPSSSSSASGKKAAKEARLAAALAPASPPASPLALAFPPRAHEVHVYHAHANFSYVQELLGNLQHVHNMFKGAAGSGSGSAAAGAVAAARMLSRSLSRAAQRVRNACLGPLAPAPSTSTPGIRLVGGPVAAAPRPQVPVPSAEEAAGRVVLACEAMHTLTEFGWAELVTCDVEQAKLLGALDLEVHDLTTGRVDAYHRQAPDHPWVHVGVSGAGTTSAEAVAALLGPASPLGPLSRANSNSSSTCSDPSAYAAPPCTPAAAAFSPSGSSSSLGFAAVAMGGATMTVAKFAQQLQEAGGKVMAAAQLLQQWIEELRAASDAAAKAAAVAVTDAAVAAAASSSSASSSAPSRATPQLVTAVV